jgi:RimJ/RimL family protein N-acetyltransferase
LPRPRPRPAAAVELVPLSEAHLTGLADLVGDPAVQRFTRIPVPPPAGFATTWLTSFEQARLDGTRECFAIVDSLDSSSLGAAAPKIDRQTATAELGYVVLPAARGRGVAVSALRQLAAWAFEELGMQRLELLISAANEPSKRVAERSGFVLEGVLRSHALKPGVREDMEIWSRLPSDPET